ncbi:Vacuolar protein sorting-associated protein 53 [Cyanidiococcus yangmingshanensis]|uniref:Vacuolar protein sorting-associated protein 53 n=1 Tax=Cyanidiococcus yangmingshanensis TaxID=2690220 RepID=A0A7J7IPS8_9RHOD|nr:Vacuolar protein sorting-associated protein 53 [Cyanidiococcus yangmingshanensis]
MADERVRNESASSEPSKIATVIDYVNQHFPSLESLDGLEARLAELGARLRVLDAELAQAVRNQLQVRRQGALDLERACQQSIRLEDELVNAERSMREAARVLNEFAAQLRPVAEARHNLLQARVQLKALIRLAKALRDIERAETSKDLAQVTEYVRQAKGALSELHGLRDLPLLDQLCQRYRVLDQHLSARVVALFAEPSEMHGKAEYQACCVLADALENGTREAVVNAFLVRRVRLYEDVFGARDSDLTPIETFERSFAWIRRELRAFDEHWSEVFPTSWQMPMALSASLGDALRRIAHRDLEEGKVDVAQLLRALQITIEFEAELTRRLNAPLTWSLKHAYGKLSTKALEKESWLVPALSQRTRAPEQPDETIVLPSAKALFIEIKRCMKRCGVLTTSQTYFNLHKAFKKHLRYYASAMERELLRIRSTSMTEQGRHESSTSAEQDLVITKVCSLILTAEYCARTTDQLAETIRHAVDQAFTESIRMTEERDEFRAIAGRAGKVLVTLTIAWVVEPAMNALQAQRWSVYPTVGDTSPVITALVEKLHHVAKRIGCQLPTLFFRFYLDKLGGSVLERFTSTLFRCKPLSDAAAQQLLLDTQSLRDGILNLVDCSAQKTEHDDPGAAAEAMLKVRLASNDNLMDAFEALIPNAEPTELRQILEWKGLAPLEAARQVVQYAERIEDPDMLAKARTEMEELEPDAISGASNGAGSRAQTQTRPSSASRSKVTEDEMAKVSSSSTISRLDATTKTSTEVRAFLSRLGERIREARLGDRIESSLETVRRQRPSRGDS